MMSATKTMVILSLATACLLTADAASAASCESLRALALPHTTIATASLVPAGPFQAVGNGGWAGLITFGGTPQAIPRNIAFALTEGDAAPSTDTRHVNAGTPGQFAIGHPEQLTDFADP